MVRATSSAETTWAEHAGELQLWFVLSGEASLRRPDQRAEHLGAGDAIAIPAGMPNGLSVGPAGCELLEVTAPDRPAA